MNQKQQHRTPSRDAALLSCGRAGVAVLRGKVLPTGAEAVSARGAGRAGLRAPAATGARGS